MVTHYAKSVVHQQIITQPCPGHPSLIMFLPLCLATILLLARVMSDFGSVAPASPQPASSFALDNGGGVRYGDDLSGAAAAQPLHDYMDDTISALAVTPRPVLSLALDDDEYDFDCR